VNDDKGPEALGSRPRRRYDNSRRAGAARETRRRIVEAAAACFAERGWDATSVQAIADRSATSPATIYSNFGSKIGVLQAWIDHAVTGDDLDIALRDRAEISSLFARHDVAAMLREFVRIGRQINERVAAPIQVARAAALSSTELATLLAENERRRQDDFAVALARLAADIALPDGLSIDRAAQLTAALCSVDLYRLLVLEAGWTSAEYEAQIARLLESSLGVGPPGVASE
jgi:AcrR family transcriptional regulator